MAAHEDLLRQLQPVVRFDSHEAFFAHDVRAMADNEWFRLVSGKVAAEDPLYVIAARPGLAGLAVSDGVYANRHAYDESDHFGLDLSGAERFVDKIGNYREMERQLPAEVRDRAYGHAWPEDPGATEVWLQYWYFYLYNDAQFSGRVDLHEGDWEMVEILVRGGEPVKAVYAQHGYAEAIDWERVEKDPSNGDCPIVYAGRGSHASYFERGIHRTHVRVAGQFVPLWWDAADGDGRHVRQQLELLDPAPPWAEWLGRWGGTQPRRPLIDGDSPGGPLAHGQWDDPASLEAVAIDHAKQQFPGTPPVAVGRSRTGLEVRFDFAEVPDRPDRLVITSTTDGQPPITDTIVVDSLARGNLITRTPLDPDAAYEVDVSTISVDGVPSRPQAVSLAPLRAGRAGAILAAFDRFWLWVGQKRRERRG
jgi:hypothetical protein